jgi:hypothetical protein
MKLEDLHEPTEVFRPRRRKITIQQVAEAMELRTKGIGYERLGMIFGVSPDCMRNNIRGAQEYGYNWWRGGRDGIPR